MAVEPDVFHDLFDTTAPDFTPVYARVKDLPPLAAGAARVTPRG